jgi:hypothetical protein
MGIVTGSDADLKAKLHGALMDEGLVGEGLCSKKVWVIKTHWPERSGKHNFDSERALLLVRSPLDCITSLFHMTLSGSHDLSVSEPDFKTFSKNFEAMVKQDMTVWKDFHEFWLKAKVPTHFVRYEDLCQRPAETLPEMMKFMFNTDDISDTRIQKIIDLSIASNPVRVYKPRAGKAHGNKHRFHRTLLVWMREQCP